MKIAFVCSIAAIVFGVLATPAGAADLRMGIRVEPDAIDPHFHNFGGNKALTAQIFEPLIVMDAHAKLAPGLALSWQALDPTTWEIRLRPDVHFQDGSALTAEDVAFTFDRALHIPNSPFSFAMYLRPITRIEVVDPLTLRMHTQDPTPLLPTNLSSIGIVSRHAGQGATTADYNSGKAAIGTGPYRFGSWAHGDHIELVRNDHYWGMAAPWEHITLRYIPNPAARLSALLSGDVDIVDEVPVQDVAGLRANPKITVAESVSEDMVGFSFDVADRPPPFITDNDGKPLAKNPLHDRRVREAINLAVNRDAIVSRIMNGQAVKTGQFMPAGAYGYDPNLPAPPYDPAKAKQLLAEAGYPDGFRMSLHSSNDRFTNDGPISEAVAQMLTRVGIKATPVIVPHSVLVAQSNRAELSMFVYFWTIDSAEPSVPLTLMLATPDAKRGLGAANRGGFTDPRFDAALGQALTTMDDARREKLLIQASEVVFRDDMALLALHNQMTIEAMSRRFVHVPRADSRLPAAEVRAAP